MGLLSDPAHPSLYAQARAQHLGLLFCVRGDGTCPDCCPAALPTRSPRILLSACTATGSPRHTEILWHIVMQRILGYNIVSTVKISPDEDRMSLPSVWRLTAPERQALTRIAKGRGGRQHPAVGQVERARVRLKCDAGPEARAGWTKRSRPHWTSRRTAWDAGDAKPWPRIPRQCGSVGPRHRGLASGTAPAKHSSGRGSSPSRPRQLCARNLAPARPRAGVTEIRCETARRTLKKRTDAPASGAAR